MTNPFDTPLWAVCESCGHSDSARMYPPPNWRCFECGALNNIIQPGRRRREAMQQLPGSIEQGDADAAKVAKAPRVTLTDIENAIQAVFYRTVDEALGPQAAEWRSDVWEDQTIRHAVTTMTLCVVIAKNGYVVIGKSAPASPENFNAELGRKLALDDAKRQLWPLMGFALKERLATMKRLDDDIDKLGAQANVGKAT